MSSRPLVLASLGVLIITVAQGCTFPGANLFVPAPVNYGVLRLNPTSSTDANKFVQSSAIQGGGDLNKISITSFKQFGENFLFATASNGVLYNTADQGNSWRTLNIPDGAGTNYVDYAKDDDEKIVIAASQNNVAKIYLSTNQKELEQVYTDVTGATSTPFIWISKTDNSKIWAIVRSGSGDKSIQSSDSGKSWQLDQKLPAIATKLYQENNKLKVLLANNQILIQSNESGSLPQFDLTTIKANIPGTILKTVTTNGITFYLTSEALYRESSEGTITKLILPITDSPLTDFAINPNNIFEYSVSIGKNVLQTKNAGTSWEVRNDVGSDQGAGRVISIFYDEYTKGQLYLGRGK